jgi:hypothetical protein
MEAMHKLLATQSQQLSALRRENEDLRRQLRSGRSKRSRSMDDARSTDGGDSDITLMEADEVVVSSASQQHGQDPSRNDCN